MIDVPSAPRGPEGVGARRAAGRQRVEVGVEPGRRSESDDPSIRSGVERMEGSQVSCRIELAVWSRVKVWTNSRNQYCCDGQFSLSRQS